MISRWGKTRISCNFLFSCSITFISWFLEFLINNNVETSCLILEKIESHLLDGYNFSISSILTPTCLLNIVAALFCNRYFNFKICCYPSTKVFSSKNLPILLQLTPLIWSWKLRCDQDNYCWHWWLLRAYDSDVGQWQWYWIKDLMTDNHGDHGHG